MNSVILTGRIAGDLDLRYTPGQMAILKFNLAVNRTGKDKGADFPRITVFGKQAENTQRYCHKGSMIGVQGRIQTGSYKDKDDRTVYTTDVIADRVEFLSFGRQEEAPDETQVAVDEPVSDFQMIDEDVPF